MENRSLTLGVTGRRHVVPEAWNDVKRATRDALKAVAQSFDGEIRVCSGLAIGADSLVAQLALELKDSAPNSNVRLVGVLPFDAERYKRDFKTTPAPDGISQRDAFCALLGRCDETIVLADPDADALDPLSGYVRLGEWLVENCDLLFALWNGNAAIVKRGGTVDVALKKTGRCQRDGSRVYCVATPELLRKKRQDGVKIYTPEPIEGAGRVALLDDAPKGDIAFVDSVQGVRELRDWILSRNR